MSIEFVLIAQKATQSALHISEFCISGFNLPQIENIFYHVISPISGT